MAVHLESTPLRCIVTMPLAAHPAQECDDGNQANNDGCSEQCVAEVCGDGVS